MTAQKSKFENRKRYDEKGSLKSKRNNDAINATGADIRMIVGRRSNGKTYPTITFDGLRKYLDSNGTEPFAYVRRKDRDLKEVKNDLFNGPVNTGWLEWYSKGKWNHIHYYASRWYLWHIKEDGKVDRKDPKPFCYFFSINCSDNYKGPDYSMIKTIILDEFIPMNDVFGVISNEWKLWQNLLSTIIRDNDDVVIYMIANTVSKNCIYFDRYKIDIDNIPQGTIAVNRFKSGGSIAVEYCADTGDNNVTSSKYFDVDDSVGSAIVTGTWETKEYPTLPKSYRKYKQISTISFNIIHNSKTVQGHLIKTKERSMIYFHLRTSPIKDDEYIYMETFDSERMNQYKTRIGFNPNQFDLDRIIFNKIMRNECYYQNNDVGELVKYFLDNTR